MYLWAMGNKLKTVASQERFVVLHEGQDFRCLGPKPHTPMTSTVLQVSVGHRSKPSITRVSQAEVVVFFFSLPIQELKPVYIGCSWKTACPEDIWQSIKHASSLATPLSQLRQHTLTFMLFMGKGGFSAQPSPACSPGNPIPCLNRAAGQARTTSPPESWPCHCNTSQPASLSQWGPTWAHKSAA